MLVYHDSQKKAINFKVLDTFSTIQYITICCLCHANAIIIARDLTRRRHVERAPVFLAPGQPLVWRSEEIAVILAS